MNSNQSRTQSVASLRVRRAVLSTAALVGCVVPVALLGFQQVHATAHTTAERAASVANASEFQHRVDALRRTVHATTNASAATTRSQRTALLQDVLDADRCIAAPDRCTEPMLAGDRPSDADLRRWSETARAIASARTRFERALEDGDAATSAAAAFDASLAATVEPPQQELLRGAHARMIEATDAQRRTTWTWVALTLLGAVAALAGALRRTRGVARSVTEELDHTLEVLELLAHGRFDAGVVAAGSGASTPLLDRVDTIARSLHRQGAELASTREKLAALLERDADRASFDPLTGLRNHRYFQESLTAEIERCRRTGGQVAVAVVDFDDMASINAQLGFGAGDDVLRRATEGIVRVLRPYDLTCRLSGTTIGIILPEATAQNARSALDRVAGHLAELGARDTPFTFSGGVAAWPAHAQTQQELLERATETVRAAKAAGKARTLVYDPAVVARAATPSAAVDTHDAALSTTTALATAVDEKDPYTRHHSELVAMYSSTIARAMRLDESTVHRVYQAGLLHDVGKIGIPEDLLLRADRLTRDDWIQLRMHPEYSYRILMAAGMDPVATWTRHHHEHFDGGGYPARLAGDAIPLPSRIVLVADAFETMTSDRAYRPALGVDHAIAELERGAGTQFDPTVVAAMVEIVRTGALAALMERYGRVLEPVSPPVERQPMPDLPVMDLSEPATLAPAAVAQDESLPTATVDPIEDPAYAHSTSELEAWARRQLVSASFDADDEIPHAA